MSLLQTTAVLLFVGALVACSRSEVSQQTTRVPNSESVSYSAPEEQQEFKAALDSAKVKYRVEMQDGKEFVAWNDEDAAAVKAVEDSLTPPSGRNSSASPELQEEFKLWLKANKIPFNTQMHHGKEFVVWAEDDTAKVHAWMKARLPPPVAAAMGVSAPIRGGEGHSR